MHPARSSLAALAVSAVAASGWSQTLDWVARFNDVAAGNDDARAVATSPTRELYVLAKYDYGYSFFKVSADGVSTHESHFSSVSNQELVFGPVVDAQGGAYLARGKVGAGARSDFALLRLGAHDMEWTESFYSDPSDLNDRPHQIAVDSAGGAAVAGSSVAPGSADPRLLTVLFGPDGQTRWAVRYDGGPLRFADPNP